MTSAELVHDTKKPKTVEVATREAMFSGDERNWAYSGPEVVVRHIHSDDSDRYPTISGNEIDDVLVTDYKIQIYLKDKTKPSFIFILKEDVIMPPLAPAG